MNIVRCESSIQNVLSYDNQITAPWACVVSSSWACRCILPTSVYFTWEFFDWTQYKVLTDKLTINKLVKHQKVRETIFTFITDTFHNICSVAYIGMSLVLVCRAWRKGLISAINYITSIWENIIWIHVSGIVSAINR